MTSPPSAPSPLLPSSGSGAASSRKPLSIPKLEISLRLPRMSVDLTAFYFVFPTGQHLLEGRDVSYPSLGPRPLARASGK